MDASEDSPLEPAPALGRVLVWVASLVAGLRFVGLGRWSLWYDEALTWADGHPAVPGEGPYNPLGYELVLRTVRALGGFPDELALRLAPALAGWAVVPLTYLAFRPFAGGARAGLAALLVALSPWQLYWSQNARFYTFAELLGLLGGALVLRSAFGGGRARALGGAGLVALGALFHLQCAMLLAALVAAPALLALTRTELPQAGRASRRLLIGLSLGAVPVGAYWAIGVWRTYVGAKAITGGLGAKLGSIAHFVLATGFYVTPVLGAAFLVGSWLAWRRRSAVDRYALAVVLSGMLAAVLASLFARVTAQYVFVLFPWIALLASGVLGLAGGGRVAEDGEPAGGARAEPRSASVLVWVLLLALPAAAECALYLGPRLGDRERWREAWMYVLEHREPGDLVTGMAAPVGELYLHPGATNLRSPRRVTWLDGYRAQLPESWSPYPRRTWFVIRPDNLAPWSPADRADFETLLREECRLAKRFPVQVPGRDLAVEVWVRE